MPVKTPNKIYRRKSGQFAYTSKSDEDMVYIGSVYKIGAVAPELVPGIFEAVELVTRLPMEAICGKSKDRELVFARMVYCVILLERGFNKSKIGRSINRKHATVINLLKKFDTDRKYQTGLEEMYQNVKERLCTQSAV